MSRSKMKHKAVKSALILVVGMLLVLLASQPAEATVLRAQPTPQEPQPTTWEYGETSVSGLSDEEKRALCGVEATAYAAAVAEAQDQAATSRSIMAGYPTSMDWRNVDGQDWTTPIRNQMGCGSCVAFGTIGAIESRMEIDADAPGLNPDLSEAQLFFCGCGDCCERGWWSFAAMSFAMSTGIVDEACSPYDLTNQTCSPCADWESRVTRITNHYGLGDTNLVKKILAQQGPMEMAIPVYEDFFGYRSGIYRHVWGDLAGYHSVAVVGYDDTEAYWIVKNSWGAGWGEEGWFRLAYDAFGPDTSIPFRYPIMNCDDPNEPNDDTEYATAIDHGQSILADICPDGDVDYFSFHADADTQMMATIGAFQNGSLLYPRLTLIGRNGTNVLAEVEGPVDDRLTLAFTVPATGRYYLRVEEALAPGSGGPDYFYALTVQPAPDIQVDATSLHAEVAMDAATDLTLHVANHGAGPLTFEASVFGGGFELAQAPPVSAALAVGDARIVAMTKAEAAVAPAQTGTDVLAAPLTPDGFGYTVRDSYAEQGPVYHWIEIAPPAGGHGMALESLSGIDDAYYWPLALPFSLPFYGTDYDEIAVSTNGTISFEDAFMPLHGAPIPHESSVSAFIAHMWSDLVIDPGEIYVQDLGSLFIIEFYEIRTLGCEGPGTWQILLFDNGNILLQFKDTGFGCWADQGGSATVGIQGSSTLGLGYSHWQPVIAENMAICFAYPGMPSNCWDADWLQFETTYGWLEPGEEAMLTLTLDGAATQTGQPGTYHGQLQISSNDPDTPLLAIPVAMTVPIPASWGQFNGSIRSTGYCDAEMTPLPGSQMMIAGARDTLWFMTPDENGDVWLWLDESHSPLTAIASSPDHRTAIEEGIPIQAGELSTRGLNLRWLQPCVEIEQQEGIHVVVPVGMSTSETMTVQNTGAVATHFNIAVVPREMNSPADAAAAALTDAQAVVMPSESKPARASAAQATSPDAVLPTGEESTEFYTVRDSSDPDGPPFTWLEIAPAEGGAGTELAGLRGVDDGYLWPVELPFPFPFYGQTYDYIAVSSNGTVYFTNAYLGIWELDWIPGETMSGVDTFIAHLWEDMVVSPGAVYAQQIGPLFVIEFYENQAFMEWGSDELSTWQIILQANGGILVQYKTLSEWTASNALVGIQVNPLVGLQYADREDVISTPRAVCFAPMGTPVDCPMGVDWLTAEPTSGTIDSGAAADVTLTFDSAKAPEESGLLAATLMINTDDPRNSPTTIEVSMFAATYALELTPSSSAEAKPGATTEHILTLTNEGNVADTYQLSLGAHTWDVTSPTTAGPIEPGQTLALSIQVTVPAGALAGAEEALDVTVQSVGDPTKSAEGTVTTVAEAVYGLTVVPETSSGCARAGETMRHMVQLTNQGNATDTFDVAVPAADWPIQVAETIGPLEAGVSTMVSLAVNVPPTAASSATDSAVVEFQSQGDASRTQQVMLTTCVDRHRIYLPRIEE